MHSILFAIEKPDIGISKAHTSWSDLLHDIELFVRNKPDIQVLSETVLLIALHGQLHNFVTLAQLCAVAETSYKTIFFAEDPELFYYTPSAEE